MKLFSTAAVMTVTVVFIASLPSSVQSLADASPSATRPMLRVTVFGGTGYVGSAVCERLVRRGHDVTAVSRRGVNPKPNSLELSKVNWVQGDATDMKTVEKVLKDSDAAVHAIGLLFDVESGLANLNKIVSGSGSVPGESSTYDTITRATAFNVIDAIENKQSLNIGSLMNKSGSRYPFCFVSAAEAGWPDVPYGPMMDGLAPQWLNRYLLAKRAVESRLRVSDDTRGTLRSVIYRPSLIWDWTKWDVLPVIPIFNIASAMGVPFVDKTVRVETLADAIVAGIEGGDIEGIQRVRAMETISQRV